MSTLACRSSNNTDPSASHRRQTSQGFSKWAAKDRGSRGCVSKKSRSKSNQVAQAETMRRFGMIPTASKASVSTGAALQATLVTRNIPNGGFPGMVLRTEGSAKSAVNMSASESVPGGSYNAGGREQGSSSRDERTYGPPTRSDVPSAAVGNGRYPHDRMAFHGHQKIENPGTVWQVVVPIGVKGNPIRLNPVDNICAKNVVGMRSIVGVDGRDEGPKRISDSSCKLEGTPLEGSPGRDDTHDSNG
ncbi:hypothetical protein AURDEDRAFT_126131 [Auricularia subglabra TFB-10046 SS5]|nr:hypothetical protein AURDEDRAFT_126131 [Auricularia subglabra TFB-10046 SS5]